ncbi:MAG: complex I subunit 5 family protein [Halolamina sp.]
MAPATQLPVLPLVVALATAVATLLVRPSRRLQRLVSVAGAAAYFAVVAVLFDRVVRGGDVLVYQVSEWTAPFGIVLVADALSGVVLGLAAVVSLAAVVFAARHLGGADQETAYHPLYHFMMAGVSGAVLTGDVFNLFVWFEVTLMASYVLVVFYSGPQQTRAAIQYVVLNLLGSAVMLLAIGGLYGTTGTLNMADIARRLSDPASYGVDPLPVLGLATLLFAVFALKAGLVPFHFWVPSAYRAAPAPVTAVLAGVVKKIGVYAVVRLYFTVFAAAQVPVSLPGVVGDAEVGFLAFFGPVAFVLAAASVVFGGVGAVGRDDFEGLLAYSSVSQVGFIFLPLAVAATAPDGPTGAIEVLGITAALVYAMNHGLAKSLLFLVAGTLADAVGTTDLDRLGGVAPRAPVLTGTAFVGLLALVGIPPLTGFFGKFLVFRVAAEAAAADAAGAALAGAVALGGAVLTIVYASRAWNRAFWGEPSTLVAETLPRPGLPIVEPSEGGSETEVDAPADADGGITASPRTLAVETTVCVALALSVVGFGVGFEFVYGAAEAAARAAVDTGGYVDAVDPQTFSPSETGGGGEGEGAGHALGTVGLTASAALAVGRRKLSDRDDLAAVLRRWFE